MRAKLFLGTIILVAVFCVASTTLAMTDQQRQNLIQQLQAQIVMLTQQLTQLIQTQQADTAWCFDFNANLRYGDSNNQVLALQTALTKQGFNVSGDTQGVFGKFTILAVKQFQDKYASEILSPYRLKSGTGFMGPTTRAKLNKLYGCTAISVVCPQDVKQCSDGSYVNRVAPGCNFSACPTAICSPNWSCSSWSTCTNSQQVRTCTDLNNCGITIEKPLILQSCTSSSDGESVVKCYSGSDCGTGAVEYNGSAYCSNNDVYRIQKVYKCSNPGTFNSYCNYSFESKLIESCGLASGGSVCSNGVCITKCITDWSCGSWRTCVQKEADCYIWSEGRGYYRLSTSACEPGYQTRTCKDLNNCSVVNRTCPTPITRRYCATTDMPTISKYYSEKTSSVSSGVSVNSIVYKGSILGISWSENDTSVITFYVILQKGGKDIDFIVAKAKNSSGSYSYRWKVLSNTPDGNLIADGSDYSIKITDTYGNVLDRSSNFTIASEPDDDYIRVIYPNGGEVFESGKTYTIKWDTNIKYSKLYIFFRNFDSDNILYSLDKSYDSEFFSTSYIDTYGRSNPTPIAVDLSAGSLIVLLYPHIYIKEQVGARCGWVRIFFSVRPTDICRTPKTTTQNHHKPHQASSHSNSYAV